MRDDRPYRWDTRPDTYSWRTRLRIVCRRRRWTWREWKEDLAYLFKG